ncbi:WYL domain-containing protein [Pseudomonas aeruginosa]
MDAFLGLLVVVCGVAAFVMMVRRTKAKGRELAASQHSKPELLTPQQRKTLNLQERKPRQSAKPPKVVTPKPSSSRAIRTGWRIGMVAFTYEDSDGDISYRTVTVHSANATYLKGECHDRQAERTFRLDRIIGDLTDCETGEIMSPQSWARQRN